MSPPSQLSARWFSDGERTTATAISTTSNNLGSALGFLIGPYIVHWTSMPVLLIIEGAIAIVVCIAILIYFPDRPPSPPSYSTAIETEKKIDNYRVFYEIRQLVVHPSFLLLIFIGGGSAGVFNAWSGMFDQILAPSFNQIEAGWLGFGCTLAGIVGGICTGYLGDSLFRFRFKLLLIALYIISAALFLYFTLALPSAFVPDTSLIPSPKYLNAIAVILGGLFFGAANPLFYELCAEVTFPINEGTSAGGLTLINNIACLILLELANVIPTNWMNAIMATITTVCALGMLAVTEQYKRSMLSVKKPVINQA